MAIQLVQSASAASAGVVTSLALAFPSNVTAGNTIIVSHFGQAIGGTINAPTDTLSNAYTQLGAQQTSATRTTKSFYSNNIAGGACTVTISSATSGEKIIVISEWSGIDDTSPLDQFASATGVSTTPATGDITPVNNNSLLYGAMTCSSNNVGITEEAGWTLLQEQIPTNQIQAGTEWKLQTTAAAEDADWTLASSQTWICHIASFKPAVVASLPIFRNPMRHHLLR